MSVQSLVSSTTLAYYNFNGSLYFALILPLLLITKKGLISLQTMLSKEQYTHTKLALSRGDSGAIGSLNYVLTWEMVKS